jgi:hypothetical protein
LTVEVRNIVTLKEKIWSHRNGKKVIIIAQTFIRAFGYRFFSRQVKEYVSKPLPQPGFQREIEPPLKSGSTADTASRILSDQNTPLSGE